MDGLEWSSHFSLSTFKGCFSLGGFAVQGCGHMHCCLQSSQNHGFDPRLQVSDSPRKFRQPSIKGWWCPGSCRSSDRTPLRRNSQVILFKTFAPSLTPAGSNPLSGDKGCQRTENLFIPPDAGFHVIAMPTLTALWPTVPALV